MNRDELLAYCTGFPAVSADYPFDETTLVFRVAGKIFALVDMGGRQGSVSLKCDPEAAGDLRMTWAAITPGYHLNKEHWNSILLDGTVPGEVLAGLVRRSWELVEAGLARAAREKAGLPPRGKSATARPSTSRPRSPRKKDPGQ